MAKFHEPFTWNTISEVLPEATEEEKDEIYEEIIHKTWTIDMIEELYRNMHK